jgi:hypothetical protein
MQPQVDLLCLGQDGAIPEWGLGTVYSLAPQPSSVALGLRDILPSTRAQALLFWDPDLELPPADLIRDLLQRPGHLWHAGLRLGMSGLPAWTDFVAPTWMLNRDPDAGLEATSWRLSLRACLVTRRTMDLTGGPNPDFQSLAGAGLEWGHRCITAGVVPRHVPALLPGSLTPAAPAIPLVDEVRFIRTRYGRKWALWASGRAALKRPVALPRIAAAWRHQSGSESMLPMPVQDSQAGAPNAFPAEMEPEEAKPRVSVIIPTLQRYPYLRTLLAQLRDQTVAPFEIIVVDQTPAEAFETGYQAEFEDLPLQVIELRPAGQCRSRNTALLASRADYILFLDDDIEAQPDLIQGHLQTLTDHRAQVSSGVLHEVGAGELPPDFRMLRVSDVFPGSNSMIRRSALIDTGLFDLAYDHGQRADGDLGMRLYLSGALMILNPDIGVLHHHAPRGGLRVHKARVITYASSRHSLLQRRLLSATEIYLAQRYFSARQVAEMIWINILATFSIRGRMSSRLLKILASGLLMPDTLRKIWANRAAAQHMLLEYPQIPALPSNRPGV